MSKQKQEHRPVLLQAVLDCLQPRAGQSYLDLTAGYGGHAAAVIAATDAPRAAVLVDRDQMAIDALKRRWPDAELIHSDFLAAVHQLTEQGRTFDMILADLGISSPHLNIPERGFSFQTPGPLDMRMDQRQTLDADQVVNRWDEADLARVLREYGEEPRAGRVAKAIVAARPIADTQQLAAIIRQAVGWRGRGKINPATKSFQAIRIAVNDELEQLHLSLPLLQQLLAPGGRLTVISFHSLEDRLVKQYFAERSGPNYDAELTLLTKRPITPTADEIVSNPRARSAKLRAGRKNKNQKKG